MSKTAAEIEQELAAKNSEARALRRALREAQKAELVSAKIALGEALSRVLFADTPQAMHALIQTLNEGGIDEEVRRVFGGSATEDTSTEEPQDEPQWGSDAGDDPTRTMNTRVFG